MFMIRVDLGIGGESGGGADSHSFVARRVAICTGFCRDLGGVPLHLRAWRKTIIFSSPSAGTEPR